MIETRPGRGATLSRRALRAGALATGARAADALVAEATSLPTDLSVEPAVSN